MCFYTVCLWPYKFDMNSWNYSSILEKTALKDASFFQRIPTDTHFGPSDWQDQTSAVLKWNPNLAFCIPLRGWKWRRTTRNKILHVWKPPHHHPQSPLVTLLPNSYTPLQNPSQTDLILLEFFRGWDLWQQSIIAHTNTLIFQKKRKKKNLFCN